MNTGLPLLSLSLRLVAGTGTLLSALRAFFVVLVSVFCRLFLILAGPNRLIYHVGSWHLADVVIVVVAAAVVVVGVNARSAIYPPRCCVGAIIHHVIVIVTFGYWCLGARTEEISDSACM